MNILGIDPGSTTIGYALINYTHPTCTLKRADWINLNDVPKDIRILRLHEELGKIISQEKPEVVAIEKLFFAKNTKTALSVSESRGVILLTTMLAGLKFFEYTPLEIKKMVTGDGNADKMQIKKMVQLWLKETRTLHARDDVFDAIAIALTCAWRERNIFSIA